MNEKILRAKNLATEAHKGQFRKFSGDEYIVHPCKVHDEFVSWIENSNITVSAETRCIMECAAYGHDIIEDCSNITELDIITATDISTLNLIKELTNPSKCSLKSRAERKQMDRDHLKFVSWEAKVIKLIDRICNLLDLSQCPDKGFVKLYANESLALLECLRGTDSILEDRLLNIINGLN